MRPKTNIVFSVVKLGVVEMLVQCVGPRFRAGARYFVWENLWRGPRGFLVFRHALPKDVHTWVAWGKTIETLSLHKSGSIIIGCVPKYLSPKVLKDIVERFEVACKTYGNY